MEETIKTGMLTLMKKSGYSKKAIEYFKDDVNVGQMENADWISEYTGPCGDVLQIYLKINEEKIENTKFMYVGCPGVAASASAITEMVKGMSLKKAKGITEKDVLEKLGGLMESKLDCVTLTVKAMQQTILEYEANKLKKTDD